MQAAGPPHGSGTPPVAPQDNPAPANLDRHANPSPQDNPGPQANSPAQLAPAEVGGNANNQPEEDPNPENPENGGDTQAPGEGVEGEQAENYTPEHAAMMVDVGSDDKNEPLGEWEAEPETFASGGVGAVVPFTIPRGWPEGYVLNEWGLKEDVPH